MNEKHEGMSHFARTVMEDRYAHDVGLTDDKLIEWILANPNEISIPENIKENWAEIASRAVINVYSSVGLKEDHPLVQKCLSATMKRKFMPGGRYLFSTGHKFHQTQNCVLMRAKDTREGWADIAKNAMMSSMTGAGLGIYYGDLRPSDSVLHSGGGTSSGPIPLMEIVNNIARGVRQGGKRRGAIWAGLPWDHPDIFKFIHSKNWSEDVKRMKAKDFNFPAFLDMTNISVCLDDEFFRAYLDKSHKSHRLAQSVYWKTVVSACQTGEPGFSVDIGYNSGEVLRNACTEICSRDPDDICNLGSINLARVSSLEEMEELIEVGVSFLLAGTVYSHLPYPEIEATRTKNRRLGLGLMGIHEWLLQRGKQYGLDGELEKYLRIYCDSSPIYAKHYAQKWELSEPIKTRAIAPNGTIGIVAETTTGIEPIFCAAYKRRFRDGENWMYEYVLDPSAKKAANPLFVEDAYSIDVERRIQMQAWIQEFVDHGISSTINMPEWGSAKNNAFTIRPFGDMLMKYLPKLRGITVYPDGARGGQPLTRVPYDEALAQAGHTYREESLDVCDITRAGGCG